MKSLAYGIFVHFRVERRNLRRSTFGVCPSLSPTQAVNDVINDNDGSGIRGGSMEKVVLFVVAEIADTPNDRNVLFHASGNRRRYLVVPWGL